MQTGGQDDLLTIFSPWEQRVVARCQGHSSFVSSVAFDEVRCDGRTYRFGSVGEDNKLILVSVIILSTSSEKLNVRNVVGFFQRGSSSTKTCQSTLLVLINVAKLCITLGDPSSTIFNGVDGLLGLSAWLAPASPFCGIIRRIYTPSSSISSSSI
jgi:hypothetical protein